MRLNHLLLICVVVTVIVTLSAGCVSDVTENDTGTEQISEPTVMPTLDPDAYKNNIPESDSKDNITAYFLNPIEYSEKDYNISDVNISYRVTGGGLLRPTIIFKVYQTTLSSPSKLGNSDCSIYEGTDIDKQINSMKSDATKNGYVWVYKMNVIIKDSSITNGVIKNIIDSSNNRIFAEYRLPAEEYDKLFS